jgi:hypothetical protein
LRWQMHWKSVFAVGHNLLHPCKVLNARNHAECITACLLTLTWQQWKSLLLLCKHTTLSAPTYRQITYEGVWVSPWFLVGRLPLLLPHYPASAQALSCLSQMHRLKPPALLLPCPTISVLHPPHPFPTPTMTSCAHQQSARYSYLYMLLHPT